MARGFADVRSRHRLLGWKCERAGPYLMWSLPVVNVNDRGEGHGRGCTRSLGIAKNDATRPSRAHPPKGMGRDCLVDGSFHCRLEGLFVVGVLIINFVSSEVVGVGQLKVAIYFCG